MTDSKFSTLTDAQRDHSLNEFHRVNFERQHEAFAPAHSLTALVVCVQEEVGELAAAVLGVTGEKKRKAHLTKTDVLDAVADAMTYLSLVASNVGCDDLEKLLGDVFNMVSERARSKLRTGLGQAAPTSHEPYQPGDRIRVTRGKYKGIERKVLEVVHARAITWLALEAMTGLLLDADFVEKVSSSPVEAPPAASFRQCVAHGRSNGMGGVWCCVLQRGHAGAHQDAEGKWLAKQDSSGSAGTGAGNHPDTAASASVFVKPAQPDEPPSRIIRSGDLEVGRRYRIVEIAAFDKDPDHAVGDVITCEHGENYVDRRQTGWPARGLSWFAMGKGDDCTGTYVTAVELVDEPEQSPQPVMTSAPSDDVECPHCLEPVSQSEGHEGPDHNLWHEKCLDGWRGGSAFVKPSVDPTIIHAAEGVVLEAGEYEVVEIWLGDKSPLVGAGHRFTLPDDDTAMVARPWRWLICGTFITAVRRVEAPKAEETPATDRAWLQAEVATLRERLEAGKREVVSVRAVALVNGARAEAAEKEAARLGERIAELENMRDLDNEKLATFEREAKAWEKIEAWRATVVGSWVELVLGSADTVVACHNRNVRYPAHYGASRVDALESAAAWCESQDRERKEKS